MFDIGWTEILVIAIVALIVFPTKDLPRLLRTVGQMVGKARRMAGDMQAQFSQALREAEREADLSDIKSSVQSANPLTDLKKTFDPVRNFGDDLKKSVMAPIPPKTDTSTPRPDSTDSLPSAVEAPIGSEGSAAAASPVEMASPTDAEKTEAHVSGPTASDEKRGGSA